MDSERKPNMDPEPDEALLQRAASFAFERLAAASDDPLELPIPLRAFVVVHTAQGVIDNGGLQHFFEQDFPGNPGYSLFVDAYRRIGAQDAAAALEQAVALFPFDAPHLDVQERNRFLNRLRDERRADEDNPIERLDLQICGNRDVWHHLATFVQQHHESFGLG